MTNHNQPKSRSRIGYVSDEYQFTAEDGNVILSIVKEIANVHGCGAPDLEPIAHDADPEVLDGIVDGPDHQAYSFITNGVEVTVHGDGQFTLVPIES